MSLPLSLLSGARTRPTTAWVPATLFIGGWQGQAFDFGNMANLFQDIAAATPVTLLGQPIGRVSDTSGNANYIKQSTAANQPIYSGWPKTLGTEVIANNRFTGTSGTSWTGGAGWAFTTTTKAIKTAGTASNLSQAVTLTVGTAYFLTYYTTRTAGTVVAQLSGGTSVVGLSRNFEGAYVEVFVATAGNNSLDFVADAAFAGAVSNVSLRPITAFEFKGAQFNGSTMSLATNANINMSGGAQATLVMALRFGEPPASQELMEFGNTYGSVIGSVSAGFLSSQRGQLMGNGGALSVNTITIGASSRRPTTQIVTYQYDFTQATPAVQIAMRSHLAALPAGTVAGSASTTTLAASGAVTIGKSTNVGAYFGGLLYRSIFINRALTAGEIAQAEQWCSSGQLYCGVIGDSTVANDATPDGSTFNAPSISQMCGALICGQADVSRFGDRIAGQTTLWNAIPDYTGLRAVFIQIGLNDINTYVGVSKTGAQVIADLQALVTRVRATVPANCKIIVSQLVPCFGWIGVSGGHAAASQQAWLDFNAAIAGGGATPITGADAVVTSHVAALDDGSHNLNPIYNPNGDGVHETAEARFIIGQAWRAALVSLGLLT